MRIFDSRTSGPSQLYITQNEFLNIATMQYTSKTVGSKACESVLVFVDISQIYINFTTSKRKGRRHEKVRKRLELLVID